MQETTPYANSVFEQPWWLETVAPGCWGESLVRDGDEVVARLPYVLRHGRVGMPDNTPTLGPWMKPEYRAMQPGNTQLSRQKELVSELLSQLPKHRSLDIYLDSANDYVLPYRWLGYRYEPSFSYRLDDLQNVEKLYANFNKTAKKNIRRAGKGIEISIGTDEAPLMDMLDKTYAGQNRKNPDSRETIARIVGRSVERKAGLVLTARDEEGHVHASSFMLYDENCAYALLGGADPVYRSSGAKSLVWYHEIQQAAKTSRVFDFEGSNIEGIENFVRQFGGTRVINYRVVRQSLLRDCMDMAKPRIKRLIGYKN